MAGFGAAWLDAREAVDADSRDRALVAPLARHLHGTGAVRIADLGAGTGANLRWLAPRLDVVQHWHLLEGDRALIDAARPRLARWAAARCLDAAPRAGGLAIGTALQVTWCEADLAVDPLPRAGAGPWHVVAASALLDLVSAAWLARLARRCARERAAVLLTLIYDGRVDLLPAHAFDHRARDAFNRHQHRDKGFGAALGPDAAAAATSAFRRHGYRVLQARSDWRLGAADRELALALLDGWRAAAAEILGPRTARELARWHTGHTRALRTGRARLRVGHVDLLALPR